MRIISNPTIEPGEKSFVVEFVVFGTETKPAVRRRVSVMAKTARGAKRIAKTQWPRSGDHRILAERIESE